MQRDFWVLNMKLDHIHELLHCILEKIGQDDPRFAQAIAELKVKSAAVQAALEENRPH